MSLVCVTVVPTILLKDFVPTLNVTKRFILYIIGTALYFSFLVVRDRVPPRLCF